MDDEYEAAAPSETGKRVARILRYLFFGALFLMLGWFGLRGCYQNGTAAMKRYLVTEEAAAFFRSGSLTVRRLDDYNKPDVDRVFYIGNAYYTEETEEFQFMIRYNVRRESLASWIAEHGRNSFTFLLTDDKGNVWPAYRYVTDNRLMYGYYRLVFPAVDLTEAETVTVCVFPDDGKEHAPSDAWERLTVWVRDGHTDPYEVSNAAAPTEGLQTGETKLKSQTANGEP